MPEVVVNVSNMSVRALVDSGCSRSIISLKLARSLNCKLLSCNEPVTLMNGSVSVVLILMFVEDVLLYMLFSQ